MPYSSALPEEAKIVQVLRPATDAAGRTSAWVSLKNVVGKASFIVDIAQGNAATIAISVLQATAVAGTGSKAISAAVPIWANLDVAASDTLVRATDATSYTTDAALKNKQVVIEVPVSALDLANGFDCVAISTGASDLANLTSASVILRGLRYQQATPPAAITD